MSFLTQGAKINSAVSVFFSPEGIKLPLGDSLSKHAQVQHIFYGGKACVLLEKSSPFLCLLMMPGHDLTFPLVIRIKTFA